MGKIQLQCSWVENSLWVIKTQDKSLGKDKENPNPKQHKLQRSRGTHLTVLQSKFNSMAHVPVFFHTCSVIQPRCLTSMPGCMVFISSFTRGKRLATQACMALYQAWAMAGSFARRNTEFFLLEDITSRYLTEKAHGRAKRGVEKRES